MPKIGRAEASIVLLLSVGMLAGCNTLQAQSRIDPQTVGAYPDVGDRASANCPSKLPYDTRSGAINLDCFEFPEADSGRTAYAEAASNTAARNRLAAILMDRSNVLCTVEMGRLTANEATVNASLSILDSAFSAASTIVTGDQAKSILSGLAGTTNAARGHINAEVYRNVLSTAVSRAIEIERDKRRAEIELKLAKTQDKYSVDEMVRDVNGYHHLCSFYRGLGLVVKAVDRTAFNAADRRRSMGDAHQLLRARLIEARAQHAATPAGPEKNALAAQIEALIKQETALITQQTTIAATDDPDD